MKITLDINKEKVSTFLNLIKSLDFVSISESEVKKDEFVLTDELKAVLDERKSKHLGGESKSYTWDEVKKSLKA